MVSVWEKWEGEEADAYEAFRYYLESIAPRRINSIATIKNIALPAVYAWAARYQWVKRAEAFDTYFREVHDRHLEACLKESAEKIAQKHAEFLSDAREIVTKELAKHLAAIRSTPRSTLSFSEVIKAGEMVIKADRLIRGLETEHVEVDMTNVSTDVLRDLREQALRAIKGE